MKETIFLPDGTTIERAVHKVKPNVPNRFGHEDYRDASGIISLDGKDVAVETCYREGVNVWRVKEASEVNP